MRLVDGSGCVRELDAETEPELFSAARVNLGCLGVVTELTFRCVDAFDLEERLELVEFDRLLADLDDLVTDNIHVKLWWLPYTRDVQVYRFNKTDAPRSGLSPTGLMDASGLSGLAFTALIRLSRSAPHIIPFMHDKVQRIHFRPRARVDRSDRIIKYAGTIPKHQETEYAIDRARASEAIDAVRRMVSSADYRVNFPFEVRFVAADDIELSPTNGRDSCYLGAYISSLEWAPRYFADFEDLMRDFDGRPHWGKNFERTPVDLRELYPAYGAFEQLRRELDPNDLFRNQFTDRLFPSEPEP